jgi:hypothetical protein
MSDTRGLLDRITAFRQRLEHSRPEVAAAISTTTQPEVSPEGFRQSLRQITCSSLDVEGPLPVQLTTRAYQLLDAARSLLDRQKAFAADPVVAGLVAAGEGKPGEPDPLVAYHGETVAITNAAVRLAQVFPESPSVQLKMCDGLEGMLGHVRERLVVQERALALRKRDFDRVDRLAAILAAMSQSRPFNLNHLAGLAEELLEDARQTRPLRFLHAEPLSTHSYPGGPEAPAPARFLAAHALNVAQVIARIVPFDYEWAGRPLPAVLTALVMDCGMMRVKAEVLAKPGTLTPDDRRVIEQHPQAGAEWLMRHVPDGAPLAAAVASHHERIDGTGYPVGMKGQSIPSLGRMLAAADVYAAVCTPRPHRDAADTRTALTDVLLMAEHGQLDKDFAEYLVQLSFYPVGSVVEMADGRMGIVAANHPNRLDPQASGRPVVAILADADGTLLPRPEHIDLSASTRGAILRTVPADVRRKVLGHRYPDLV